MSEINQEKPELEAPSASNAAVKNNKTRYYKLGFALSVVVLLISFVIGSAGSVTKPYVESKLQLIAANIAAQAQISGDEAMFTYGEVKIEGGLLHNKIIVANPRLEYTANLPFGNVQKTDITTTRATVSSDSISSNTIAVNFPDSIEVMRDGFAPISIMFSDVPEYEFSQISATEQHTLHVSPSFTMTTHVPGEDLVKMQVKYSAKPTLKRSINRQENKSDTEVLFQNLEISSSAEKGVMQFKKLSGVSSEEPSGTNARHFESSFEMQQFGIAKNDAPKGPYDLVLDINGTYLAPVKTEKGYEEVRDMEVTIDKLQLTHKDYDVNISGAISVKPDDMMPFGLLNIGIKGLDAFRNSEFVPVANVTLKDAVIGAITGNEDAKLKDAFFTLKRDKNGTFFIGETSFENLVGLIVTQGLSNSVKDEESKDDKASKPEDTPMPKEAPKPEVSSKSVPLPPMDDAPDSRLINDAESE